MMRWNVVIGGQAFSLTLAGYMHYVLPMIPHGWETLRRGCSVPWVFLVFPFVLFYFYAKFLPIFPSTRVALMRG